MSRGTRLLVGRTRRDTGLRFVATLLALSLITAAASLLHNAQAKSREQLEQRQKDRVALSASFVDSYLDGIMDREKAVATRLLIAQDPQILDAAFQEVVEAFGFTAAVVLDNRGALLASYPSSPSTLGKNIAAKDAHLRSAVGGRRAVSTIVPSAVTGEPVAGLAVPFGSGEGRRVISGAYNINDTPLREFLHNASALSGSASFLVDTSLNVVASSTPTQGAVRKLSSEDAPLAEALAQRASGHYRAAKRQRFFVSAQVGRTPWTLVTSVPRTTLYAPVSGASRLVPWFIIGLLGLAVMIAGPLAAGLIESRRRLRISHQQLQHIASLDELTGLFNRRYVREQLSAHLAGSRRHGYPVSVAVLDLDHFKRINDTFGHSAGDTVLSDVARAMAAQLRAEDVLCRWGGEEFLLLLPHLDADGADRAADRMRAAVEQLAIPVGTGGDIIHVTLSAGVSTNRPDEHPDALIHRADLALYVAKTSGRNRVKRAEFGIRPSDPIVS
ncbi:MAG: two-component system, cell cycle response regulator [Frankiaceae bacterium]|nr:two-component system, cell cycle response regulator [Frankiaceae bacterium]MDX6273080.1 two-component system, cell cycle response regulator [Frankiales bacterium]